MFLLLRFSRQKTRSFRLPAYYNHKHLKSQQLFCSSNNSKSMDQPKIYLKDECQLKSPFPQDISQYIEPSKIIFELNKPTKGEISNSQHQGRSRFSNFFYTLKDELEKKKIKAEENGKEMKVVMKTSKDAKSQVSQVENQENLVRRTKTQMFMEAFKKKEEDRIDKYQESLRKPSKGQNQKSSEEQGQKKQLQNSVFTIENPDNSKREEQENLIQLGKKLQNITIVEYKQQQFVQKISQNIFFKETSSFKIEEVEEVNEKDQNVQQLINQVNIQNETNNPILQNVVEHKSNTESIIQQINQEDISRRGQSSENKKTNPLIYEQDARPDQSQQQSSEFPNDVTFQKDSILQEDYQIIRQQEQKYGSESCLQKSRSLLIGSLALSRVQKSEQERLQQIMVKYYPSNYFHVGPRRQILKFIYSIVSQIDNIDSNSIQQCRQKAESHLKSLKDQHRLKISSNQIIKLGEDIRQHFSVSEEKVEQIFSIYEAFNNSKYFPVQQRRFIFSEIKLILDKIKQAQTIVEGSSQRRQIRSQQSSFFSQQEDHFSGSQHQYNENGGHNRQNLHYSVNLAAQPIYYYRNQNISFDSTKYSVNQANKTLVHDSIHYAIGAYLKQELTKQKRVSLQTTLSAYNSSNYFHVGPRYQLLSFMIGLAKFIQKNRGKTHPLEIPLNQNNRNLIKSGKNMQKYFSKEKTKEIIETCSKYYSSNYFHVGPRSRLLNDAREVLSFGENFAL